MAIVETKKTIRPNTSIPFFNQSTDPALIASKEAAGHVFTEVEQTATYLKRTTADGSVTNEFITSDNGLLQTTISTFSDLATYSQVDTAKGIALDHAYQQYVDDSLIATVLNGTNQYTQTGIDQPFTCTTTYAYDSDIDSTYPLFESFIAVVESSDKLISFVNNGSTITAVHQYLNSEDFTETHWDDYKFIGALYTGGVTRTITYALVGSDA
jgi:hypothetical protein